MEPHQPVGQLGELPQPPWRLRGRFWIVPAIVPLELARRLVPSHVRVLPILPGRTLGGLLLARYGSASSLAYRELLIVGALVQSGRRVGLWTPRIWVDSATSAAAGRSLWGLPKQLASFDGDPPGVRVGAYTVLRVAAGRSRVVLPVPVIAAVFGQRADGEVWTPVYGLAAIGAVRARLDIPPESPLRSVGLRPARFAVAGRARVRFPAARRVDAGVADD